MHGPGLVPGRGLDLGDDARTGRDRDGDRPALGRDRNREALRRAGIAPGGRGAAQRGAGHVGVPEGAGRVPRVGNLTDTGFAPTTSLAVTVTLHHAAESSPGAVCFNSSVPFFSQASPKVAKAGTGVLLSCVATTNVAPCVLSSKQVGTDFVVNFVAPLRTVLGL